MKINRKIVAMLMAIALMPVKDIYAAGTRITAAQAFYALAKQNNIPKIQMLRMKGYSIESTDARGYNPVCIAIMRQDRQAYRTLISQGANQSPPCIKKIPESLNRRFFGLRAMQTSIKEKSKYAPGQWSDTPLMIGAGALGAGAIAAAIIFRGDTKGDSGGVEPTPPTPTPTDKCENGTYDKKTNKCNCNAGYGNYGNDKACYADIANCEKQNTSICSQCVTGYILNDNKCYAQIANCTKQTIDKCTQCDNGYGLYGGDGSACYKEIDYCAVQSQNICTQCITGYDSYGDPSKTRCYKKIENCVNQIQTACKQCAAGYDTYGAPDASYCYESNPCSAYANTVPQRSGTDVECVCNANKGYTGEKEHCILSDGDAQEGDGNHEKWDNVNELYCNSHGKYLGDGICQCYTNRGYTGTNSNCTVEECCTSCVEPTYIQDETTGLCYFNLNCTDHKKQQGNRCVCEDGYIDYNGGCYEKLTCDINKVQQGNECVCKPNYDDDCAQCLPGYTQDEYGNCNPDKIECEEHWTGTQCDICPVQFKAENGHCGLECAVNRKPISENPTCLECAGDYVLKDGLCVITDCSTGKEGYIENEYGECVCDTANGYVLTRLGICERKGEDVVGIKDSNINNSQVKINYNGLSENIMRDIYGMKPTTEVDGSVTYYESVYNALSSNGTKNARIEIENRNAGANKVYGIYQPHTIYNAAAINRGTDTAVANGDIIIKDTNGLGQIYGLYNTTEDSEGVSKDIYNAFAFGNGESVATEAVNNKATGNIKITKDHDGSGEIVAIHGVSNIFNAYANTREGTATNVEAIGNIEMENLGQGNVIGIEGTSVTADINNALSYLDSPVSKSISIGTIKLKGNNNVYGISAKGTVANSETEFSRSFSLLEEFSSTGTIDVTSEKAIGKAYGIYVAGSNTKSDIYNALGYKSTGTIISANNEGGSAYGIWNNIGTYTADDGSVYYNNIYNAFRSSAKYGGINSTAKGTINININGNDSGTQEASGIYGAGDIFNAYAQSLSSEALDVQGSINIIDTGRTSDMTLKGVDGGGATIANAYATGNNENTATKAIGNISITTTGNKEGTTGSAVGIYSTAASVQTAKIYNAALINDKSNVEGNITIQSTNGKPFTKMYGIYTTNYNINNGNADEGHPKDIYNAYYENSTGVTEGSVQGTIKVLANDASRASSAEYYGIFTNGGRAYNVYTTDINANVKGTIEVNVKGSENTTIAAGMRGINNAYLYNTGNGQNSLISVTTDKVKSNAYGMMGENSYLTNNAIINVESKKANAYGLYVQNGTAINDSQGVLTVRGATGSYGIYAVSTDDKVNTIVQNAGVINLIGAGQNVGIYASGTKAKVQNTGTININGSRNDTVCDSGECENNVGIMLVNGAELVNGGIISSSSDINLSAMGHVTLAQNGSFSSLGSISGDLEVAKDTVMNNFADEVVLSDALEAADVSQTNTSIKSFMYNTAIKPNSNGAYDIVLNKKDFSELTNSTSEAAYLNQNYAAEKNAVLFNSLKAAPTATAAEITEANLMGKAFIPNITEEELKIQRSLGRTMTDELFKESGEIRKIVGADAMKIGRDSHGTLTGYDIKSQSSYALYDKKMNNKSRLGLGLSFTHTDTDYDDDSRRKNFTVQGYVPLTYKLNNELTAVSLAHIGYSDGDYTRRSNNQSFKADTSAITYGLLNEMRYRKNLGIVNVTPFVGLNAEGWYQDSISEGADDLALHLKSTNVFSLESALGLIVDKDITFNEDNRLNVALGIGYYHEFADPYKGYDAHHTGAIGTYKLKNKIHSDDRGIISAKLKYDYKAFSIYAELLQYLEEEHPTEFDGGFQYRF